MLAVEMVAKTRALGVQAARVLAEVKRGELTLPEPAIKVVTEARELAMMVESELFGMAGMVSRERPN